MRCLNIMHTTWPYCQAIFISLDHLHQTTMCRRLWYNGLGSSTRKSLEMGYADMCINGKPAYMHVENFSNCCSNFTPTCILTWASVVHASDKEDFSVGVGSFRLLTLWWSLKHLQIAPGLGLYSVPTSLHPWKALQVLLWWHNAGNQSSSNWHHSSGVHNVGCCSASPVTCISSHE